MQITEINRYKSWLISGGLAIAVVLWLVSGQFGEETVEPQSAVITSAAESRDAVRVRTQSAEEVLRTIKVNGKTAPARIVQLAAETDGPRRIHLALTAAPTLNAAN